MIGLRLFEKRQRDLLGVRIPETRFIYRGIPWGLRVRYRLDNNFVSYSGRRRDYVVLKRNPVEDVTITDSAVLSDRSVVNPVIFSCGDDWGLLFFSHINTRLISSKSGMYGNK